MTGIEPLAYLAVRVFTSTSWIAAGIHNAVHFDKTAQGMAVRGIPPQRLLLPIVLLMDLAASIQFATTLATFMANSTLTTVPRRLVEPKN